MRLNLEATLFDEIATVANLLSSRCRFLAGFGKVLS